MNTTDQQTDTHQDEHPADPKSEQLRQTLENLTLQKMIDQVQEQDLNHKELCNILHTCYQLKKADAAEEKTRSAERIAMQRLKKTNQSTRPTHSNPPNSNAPSPNANPTNPDATPTNPAHNRLPLRDPDSPQTQPGALDHPNTNPTEQSHQDFCRNLARAAMDIWGVDISKVCKTEKPQDEESDPSATEDLYDIPPQHRQGATPIQGSQEKYGQPKYTRKQWRRVMFRAIRENYGIYDDHQPTPFSRGPTENKRCPAHPKHQPEALARTARKPINPHQSKTTHATAKNQPEAPASTAPNPRTNTPTSPKRQRGPPAPHALANPANDQRSVPRPACRLAALPDKQTIHSPPNQIQNHQPHPHPLASSRLAFLDVSTLRRFDLLTF